MPFGNPQDWFDAQGVQGWPVSSAPSPRVMPYSAPPSLAPQGAAPNQGSFAGVPSPESPGGPLASPTGQPGAPAAFDPRQQVGHNGTTSGGMTREQYRDAWQGSGATNLAQLQDFLGKNGGTLMSGNGVVTTPFGEQIDMLQGARSGRGSAAWGGMDGPAAGAPLTAPAGRGHDGAAMPAMSLASMGMGSGGPAIGQPGRLSTSRFDPFAYESFKAPDPFKAPTLEEAQNEPGYAFGLNEGRRALENSAAARGTLLTGDTAKAIERYGNDYASTKYGDVYNRALQTYGTNFQTPFSVNQANNAGRMGAFTANTNADLGYGNLGLGYTNAQNTRDLGFGNIGLGYRNADINYDLGLRNNALGYTQAGNALTLGMGNLGLGWANYGLNAQGQDFGQGLSLGRLGLDAAALAGGYGSSYGNAAGGYLTGAGNARAAGQAAGGGAWGNTLGGFGNAGLGYALYRGMNPNGAPPPYPPATGGYSGWSKE